MSNFIRNLASDLLRLEVNTIIKQNMTAEKIPANKRVLLRNLADQYRQALVEYGLALMPEDLATKEEADKMLRWRYGGEFSFREISNFARRGLVFYENRMKETTDNAQLSELNNRRQILIRIRNQSSNVVGLFKIFRGELAPDTLQADNPHEQSDKQEKYLDTYHANYARYQRGELTIQCVPFASHQESKLWNNDLEWRHINAAPELPFTPDMLSMVYKAYEIGTEQIILQTVIQIEGDITSYITPTYINLPDHAKEIITNTHNRSINTSIQFWNTLFTTVVNLAGKTFDQIFARK